MFIYVHICTHIHMYIYDYALMKPIAFYAYPKKYPKICKTTYGLN